MGFDLKIRIDIAQEAVEFFKAQFTEDKDVRKVVFRLNGESVSGPDGFTGQFYHAGFVKGRSIVENILLTQKIVTDIRKRGRPSNVVIKLDMAKAYDRLSWLFLRKVSRQMGFGEVFIDMIYKLVPGRALDDLFDNPNVIGFKMPKWSKNINYLSYVDDTIIISSSHYGEIQLILNVLEDYEAASRQKLNKEKSFFYMHENAPPEEANTVHLITTFQRHYFPFTYVGCLIFYNIRKKEFYKGIVLKVHEILHAWKGKLISIGEKGSSYCSCARETNDTLWTEFMRNKYCKKFNEVLVPWRNGSQVWNKMMAMRDLLEHQIWWQLKRGYEKFWYDNWTGLGALYHVTSPDHWCDETVIHVRDVMIDAAWHEEQLREILPDDITDHIMEKISPPNSSELKDKAYWDTNGRASHAFCIRDGIGDLFYAQVEEIFEATNNIAEARAILEALK
ncbi:uncharacterized protein [Nicotiana tomentosiformis]|uniref:uncharacterized protein n=1 Tax=Nicotiana tomentosiformis TaxID=4098 RepID=UPI00388CCAC9